MQKEVYKALRDVQDKYVYFLLTATGAAVAFAVTQTQTAKLAWTQAPLGFALLFWGLSFFCGCRHIQHSECADTVIT